MKNTHTWVKPVTTLVSGVAIGALFMVPLATIYADDAITTTDPVVTTTDTSSATDAGTTDVTTAPATDTSTADLASEPATDMSTTDGTVTDTPTTPTTDTTATTDTSGTDTQTSDIPPVSPTVASELSTDKADYNPGQTATIFGKFFGVIQEIVLKIFGTDENGGSYTESIQNVTADDQGSFTTTYTLDNIFRPLYTVTAESTVGTLLAQTTFTDAPSTNFSLSGFGANQVGSGSLNLGWTGGNLGNTWSEGEWVPYKLVITNVQSNYPGLVGFPSLTLSYDFTGNNGSRFVDLVRGLQVGATDLTGNNAWPTDSGTAYPLTTRTELENAQNDIGNTVPLANTWTGFQLLNLPNSQINRLVGGTAPSSVTQDRLTFMINPSDLTAHGLSTNAGTIVIYFQLHESRTFVWGNSLQSGYNAAPADAWGGDLYGSSPFNTDKRNGSSFVPGSSGHVHAETTGIGSLDVPIPIPDNPGGAISGLKWRDDNANGAKDGTEPTLSGWTVNVSGTLEGINFSESTTTDGSGNYSFPNISAGTSWLVKEFDQRTNPSETGYTQTYPTLSSTVGQGSGTSVSGSGYAPVGWNVNLTLANPSQASMNFGNRSQIAPTVVTTIHDGNHNPVTSVNAGTTVHDSAAVSGSAGTPTGTVDFYFFNSNNCTGATTTSGTGIALNGSGIADPSSNQGPLGAGSYSFRAHYNGDSHYFPANAACEPLTVNKVSPSISTTPNPSSASVGATLSDTATLSGGYNPTGNVTFKLYAPSDASCSGTPAYTVTDGTVPYSADPGFVSNAAGTWHWTADYAGDTNNNPASSGCSAEPVTVSKYSPSISTTLSASSVNVGTAVHDSSTLIGASSNAGGTVTYTVYTNDTCSAGAQSAGTKTVTNGAVPDSDPITFSTAGDYYWQAAYSGDAANNSATSQCTDEHLVVSKLNSNTVTVIHDASHATVTSVAAGTTVHDQATVSGSGPTPTGSVTFKWFTTGSCSATPTNTSGALSLTGGVVDATGFAQGPLSSGSYSFQAVYSGDSTYNSSTGECEPLTVSQLTPSVATDIHDVSHAVVTSVDAGTTVHDKATVSGSFGTPTGTVDFTFYTDNACTQGAASAGSGIALVSGVAHPSSSEGPLTAGSYSFKAHYNGDTNYVAADGPCEPLTVNKVTPSLLTTIHDPNHGAVTSVALGSTVHDSAAISGGYNPTGNVNFTFYSNGSCTGDGTSAGSVALSSGVAHPSSTEGSLTTGSYSFKAHYVGDTNNNPADASCEPLTVNKADTSLVTEIHNESGDVPVTTSLPLGSSVHDKATLSGKVDSITPTGNVNFTFYSDSACTVEGTSAGSITIDSDGVAHPSSTEGPLAAGSYSFKAHYVGDSNYNSSDAACEPFTVDKAQLTVDTVVHDATDLDKTNASVPLGSVMHDTATVSGGVQGFDVPTPTFTLTSNYGEVCDQGASVANDGTEGSAAKSAASAALGAGSYAYRAQVAGNDNYDGDIGDCEPFTVVDAQITITGDSTNEVGQEHVFTVTVKKDLGDGSGFVPAEDETVTPGLTGIGSITGGTCTNTTTGVAGQCTVIVSSATPGMATVHVSVTLDVNGVSITRGTGDGLSGDSADTHKTWVDANIALDPLSATNNITDAHIFTAMVSQDTGSGWTNVPDGTPVTFSLLNNAAGASFVGPDNCTTVSGSCTVTVNSATPGSVDLHASTTVNVLGVVLTRETGDGLSQDSTNATKTWVAGGLEIVKNINLSGYPFSTSTTQDFTFTVQGPSFPSGTSAVIHVVNGEVTNSPVGFSNIIPGAYTVTENDPGIAWTVAGGSGVTVNANATSTVTVTNTIKLPHTTISISSNTQETLPGENVILTISDTNDGAVPLSNNTVTLTYGATTFVLDRATSTFTGGDTTNVGVMDPGETWTWTVTVLISADTTFTVSGDGLDPLGNHISTANGYTTETKSIQVKVIGTTRTLGFWQTHTDFTTWVFGHTTLNGSMLIGSGPDCPSNTSCVGTSKGVLKIMSQVFGGFYAPMAKTSTGVKRNQIDQARINMLQQLLAAKLNCAAFGCSTATQTLINNADAAYAAGTNKNLILSLSGQLDTYNNSGDTYAIPSGLPATGKATPKTSQSLANLAFWNQP